MNRCSVVCYSCLCLYVLLLLISMVGVLLDTHHQVVLLSLECVFLFSCLFCEGVKAQVFSFVFSGRT